MDAKITTCKNCGHQFTGKYCNNCGEKVYTEKDRSVIHFFEEGFHFITHFEGKFFTTIKTLFTRPGKVSVDYCDGKRKKYFKPLSLFLLLVVLYLLFPFYQGLNQKAYYHMHGIYGPFATAQVNGILARKHLSMEQFETIFHHKSEITSKFLLLIIIPVSALFFWAITFKRRKYFFDQMVFAAEVNSIFLLWGFLLQPLVLALLEKIYRLFTSSYFEIADPVTGLIMYVVIASYVSIASRRFYNLKTWQSIILSVLFVVVHSFIVQLIYKFILFVIVINLI